MCVRRSMLNAKAHMGCESFCWQQTFQESAEGKLIACEGQLHSRKSNGVEFGLWWVSELQTN